MFYKFAVPSCAAADVCVSNRGGISGLDVVLSSAPERPEDAAAVKLAVECGLWDRYWGIRGFPFDPQLSQRVRNSQTGTAPKSVSWPGDEQRGGGSGGGGGRRRAVWHGGVALLMYRHTWVGHFGHNLMHNVAAIVETFAERGLLHLLRERSATFVALDLAPAGAAELPAHMLSMLFGTVLSASALPVAERHCFARAILGQAHRHMLHMNVYGSAPLAQRRFYSRAMRPVLEHAFCRHGTPRGEEEERPRACAKHLGSRRRRVCAEGWVNGRSGGGGEGGGGGGRALPAAHVLLLARCTTAEVHGGTCAGEDPTGHAGRRAILNAPEVRRRAESRTRCAQAPHGASAVVRSAPSKPLRCVCCRWCARSAR